MSHYTRLIANVVFPLQERLKKHSTLARRRQLEHTQWWSREAIEALQLNNLKRFLLHCQHSVPYYQTLFRQIGFDAHSTQGLTDIQQLPALDKATIRANMESLKAPGVPVSRFNTGGSSGEPLIFFLSQDRVSHDVAAKWRATRWWGVDIGDPEIVVWGSPIELGSQSVIRHMRDRLFRSELLSATKLSDARLDSSLDRIVEARPKMLFGYPSVISMLAKRGRERDLKLDALGVQVVFVTAECLYDHQRQTIETTFACPVANGYGGRDAGFIAHQCPQGGMHLSAEDILVEILDESGQPVKTGQKGEIVVTHTATTGFPFLRYRTGDVGCLTDRPCPCGRGLPLIEKILGRTNDFIVSGNGEKHHGSSLTYVLRGIEGIASFKIVQHDRVNITVMLSTNPTYCQSSEQGIRQAFQDKLGDDIHVTFEYLPTIPAEASGKYRYVVSYAN